MFPEDEVPDRFAGPEACDAKGPKWRWEREMIETVLPGYDEYWRRYRANYCGMIRLIDDEVRRLIEHLESQGLMDDTILIFTSDHGDYAGDYGLQRKGVEMPECLVHVPLIIAGPGVEPMRLSEEFVSLVDLMPTLCEALGEQLPFGAQGRSLWPMLAGDDYPKEEFRSVYAECGFGGLPYDEDETPPLHFPIEEGSKHFLGYDELNSHTQSGNLKMVRMGKWKLLYDVAGAGQLYDVENDPGELNNRYDDPDLTQIRQLMLEELLRWTIRTDDDLPGAKYVPKRAERNWHRK